MKVLWITNIVFPEALELITGIKHDAYGGGWMIGSANQLIASQNIELYVATVSSTVKKLTILNGKSWVYYIIPIGKGNLTYNKEYETSWKIINNHVKPDIVHIHGTEFTHGLAYVKAVGKKNVVVSIQGMKSVIAEYYTAGLSWKDIICNMTIHDFLKGGIYAEKNAFHSTGLLERELIKKVDYVIGRTTWDKSHTYSINRNRKYFVCNETLQSTYYAGDLWSHEKCKKHSIFISQAYYPLKGMHIVLKAIPLIIEKYPDLTIRVAGNDITSYHGFNGLRHNTTYWKYLKKIIHKYDLQDRIRFTGHLAPEQMKQEYLFSNVFICPSSIENSPNSLCEAQILGVPCICSYAGGIPDLMKGDEEHLYRFDDYEMLAYLIDDVFTKGTINPIVKIAEQRHNPKLNNDRLLAIYNEILNDK